MKKPLPKFTRILRAYRAEHDLSRSQLGARLNIPLNTLDQYLSGRREPYPAMESFFLQTLAQPSNQKE